MSTTPIITAVRSAKGGNGATTIATALSVMVAERHTESVLLVSRDAESMCGTNVPLSNLTISRSLSLPSVNRYAHVIIDVETGEDFPDANDYIVVMRQCYLSVRQAHLTGVPTNSNVMSVIITEPGRALSCDDVDCAMGFAHSADMELDPQVARAIDAGLMCARLPHSLRVGLRGVCDSVCWAGEE